MNALAIRANRLYVASPDNEELKIVDVTDPLHIFSRSGLNAPGGSGNGKSLALLGPLTYLGRTLGGSELHVINDQANLIITSTYNPDVSINSLAVAPGFLFAATTGTKGLQIWSIASPKNIIPVSTAAFSGTPRAVRCGRGALFVITENPSTLYIISDHPYVHQTSS